MLTTAALGILVLMMFIILASVKKKPQAAQGQALPSDLLARLQPVQPAPVLAESRRMTAREESEAEAMNVVQAWYQQAKDDRFRKEVLADLGEMINSQSV